MFSRVFSAFCFFWFLVFGFWILVPEVPIVLTPVVVYLIITKGLNHLLLL